MSANDAFIEQLKVRAVIDRYFHCVDSASWAKLRTIFTDDASFEFNLSPTEKKVLKGGQNIADYFQDRNKIFRTKTHYVGHAEITIEGSVAKADVYAISNVIMGEKVAIRGLRYADDLVKGADGQWRFQSRLHKGLWQYYAAFVEPEVPKT
jgi:hypothetical protein